ncbi:hypothetical protein F4823DRAFT_599860 [Ustulina deusta]|nr:hypothetical protein F4823DRAFT_599860 [Ustulina deusta]
MPSLEVNNVNDYFHVPCAPSLAVLGPVIENYRSLNYLGTPRSLNFNSEMLSQFGGLLLDLLVGVQARRVSPINRHGALGEAESRRFLLSSSLVVWLLLADRLGARVRVVVGERDPSGPVPPALAARSRRWPSGRFSTCSWACAA